MGNKLKLELQRSFSFPGPHFCGMMDFDLWANAVKRANVPCNFCSSTI